MTKPEHQFWLQRPVLPFMILAIVIGCTQALWQALRRTK